MKKLDLTNQRFGRLTAIKRAEADKYGRYKWLCRCDCGKEKTIHGRHLVQGKTFTCGCRIGCNLAKPFLNITGENHPKWKGGRHIGKDGYVRVYIAPYTYEAEHRLACNVNDSSLVVHHKNHNKQDNRPENLVCMTRQEHAIEHELGKTRRMK